MAQCIRKTQGEVNAVGSQGRSCSERSFRAYLLHKRAAWHWQHMRHNSHRQAVQSARVLRFPHRHLYDKRACTTHELANAPRRVTRCTTSSSSQGQRPRHVSRTHTYTFDFSQCIRHHSAPASHMSTSSRSVLNRDPQMSSQLCGSRHVSHYQALRSSAKVTAPHCVPMCTTPSSFQRRGPRLLPRTHVCAQALEP